MTSLAILGAGGFVGRAVIELDDHPIPLKAVSRFAPGARGPAGTTIAWRAADLSRPGWEQGVLEPGDVVVNLAYTSTRGTAGNLGLIDAIIGGCRAGGAVRLVHCSTAAVVGATTERQVTEATRCEPRTPYERNKWLVEQRVIAAAEHGLDVGIARPTTIVGVGGRNLASLAESLIQRSTITNYARACLFGSRSMHLIPVRDVARALVHLALMPSPLQAEVYLISADDDPDNSFPLVEAHLCDGLGLPVRRLPAVPLPKVILSTLLRFRGRSETYLHRYYSAEKLKATGFERTELVASAVRRFGQSFLRAESSDPLPPA